jgi:predicted Zn-dependent peptidase
MLDRKVTPPFVKSTAFDLIKPQEKKLDSGIDLFLVPGGQQEVLKIEIILKAGKWFEEKPGAAYFTSHLLSKGTRQKSSFEIAGLFDKYGAHLEINPGLDFVSISLYALTRNLSPVLNLLIEILTAPTFTQKEFDQTKSVFLQNLKVNNEKTSYVSSKLFRKNLFGDGHPYGSELEESDVNGLLTRHLEKHFLDYFTTLKIFVSGKIDPGNERLMMDAFSDWRRSKEVPDVEHNLHANPRNEYQEKKGSVQSSVRVGKRSVLRADPDYVPVLFVTHILGGYFGSRLMKNIREEKGLTYGISASVNGLKHDSYLVIGADVNKENITVTFEEIRKELKNLRLSPISQGELETTKNHFIGSLQSEITTPFAHADKIKAIQLYGLAPDHYQKMISRIEGMTADDVLETGAKYFDENTFYEVAVG